MARIIENADNGEHRFGIVFVDLRGCGEVTDWFRRRDDVDSRLAAYQAAEVEWSATRIAKA